MTEIKTCKNCRNDYAYDAEKPQYKDYCPTCVDSQLVTVAGYTPNIKDALSHDKSYQDWARKEKVEREVFMRKKLNKHLKWWDWLPFFIYEKLADYFENRVKIIHLEAGGSYQNAHYGVEIYGVRYLKTEKTGDEFDNGKLVRECPMTEKEIFTKEYPPTIKEPEPRKIKSIRDPHEHLRECVCDIAGAMRTEVEIQGLVCSLCSGKIKVKPDKYNKMTGKTAEAKEYLDNECNLLLNK